VLQRGRVVDAVAGHRHDLAAALPRLDDLELVHRRHAGIDGHLIDDRRELAVAHSGKVVAGQLPVARAVNADFRGHGHRRQQVIPRDHDRADVNLAAHAHRFLRLVAWRIHHSNQAEEREIALNRLLFERGRYRPHP
jgi:hypothetical protein